MRLLEARQYFPSKQQARNSMAPSRQRLVALLGRRFNASDRSSAATAWLDQYLGVAEQAVGSLARDHQQM